MSSSFYVILPSNTNIEGNRTNSFRVRLPRKLQFNSEWSVGLAVLVYPHTWPLLGTTAEQYVRVEWQTGEQVVIAVPAASARNPMELEKALLKALGEGSEELASELRTLQTKYHQLYSDLGNVAQEAAEKKLKEELEEVADESEEEEREMSAEDEARKRLAALKAEFHRQMTEKAVRENFNEKEKHMLRETSALSMESWIHVYQRARLACRFEYNQERQRFRMFMNRNFIKQVELSEQLAYMCGFRNRFMHSDEADHNYHIDAKFIPDMKGGISSFLVYAPDLIEPVFIGDCATPVLRVVNIRGEADEIIEETYFAIQYHRVIVKEISEIFIEIRTSNGILMPFQYGICNLTLHFKKMPYF
jgi:hypothetical protein